MQLTTLVTIMSAVSSVTAIAIPNPFEDSGSRLDKRGLLAVKGLTDGFSGRFRPYRQEINQFIKNADQLNLYLIGLEAIQADQYSNPLSYYSLSGIHGRPYVGWNNEANTGYPGTGYCTHASILFPTWHRPYLALYEQNLHNKIAYLVTKFPVDQQPRWQAALKGFRIPYWDWAINNGQMPSIVGTQQTVTVTKWDGNQYNIANPLYSYRFAQGAGGANGPFPTYPFYQWQNTLRYPTNTYPSAQSQPNLVNGQLANNGGSLKQRVFNILVDSAYHDYQTMSNKNAGTGASDSLESIHDAIHALVGNGGHMSYVDYSAFDPIFWLHHANVDRIFAIWQALNPNSYVSSQTNPYGTYGEPVGTVETSSTPLTPFRRSDNTFWTSDQIRSTQTFGYAYPETGDWKYSTNALYVASVKKAVISLYGTTNTQIASAKAKKRDLGERDGVNATAAALHTSVRNDKYYDWKVDVTVNKMAAGGSFFVHFFLGTPSEDPKQWSFQPELVGDYAVFVNAMVQACPFGNCPPVDNIVSGSVPLGSSLVDNILDIGSLNPANATQYLKDNLQWRVSLMNDTAFPIEQMTQLQISVLAAQVTLPADPTTEFPTYGNYTTYPEITAGKTGGISQ